MSEWIRGCINGWIDRGGVDGGWMDGNMNRQKDEWLERQKDGKFNGWDAGLGDNNKINDQVFWKT